MKPTTQQNWGGVWIDHFKAVLVLPKDHDSEVSTMYSGLESKHRSTGGKAKSQPYMHETAPFSSQHHEAHERRQLEKFYQQVSEALEEVTDLLVLGSGRAPQEFTDHFLHDPRNIHALVTTEKAEDMTERQLQKTVREHFGHAAPRQWPDMPGQPFQPSSP
jgi:hypothetical protein